MKYRSEKKNSYIFYKELERMILKELHLCEALFSILNLIVFFLINTAQKHEPFR